ncbi:hypothetical protein Tco_0840368 [Tanacetum coccineum]|uniref:Uncharacterized protein n=1 Tax=Tanacetum coccineum TaxID=301880 RepID=A0ABQ5AUI1_9ASTR
MVHPPYEVMEEIVQPCPSPPKTSPLVDDDLVEEEAIEVPNDFGEPKNLEEFFMNDDINGDLGDFLIDNDLLPSTDLDSFGAFLDSDNGMGIRLDDLGEEIKDFLDAQDPMISSNKGINPPLRP